MSKVRIERSYKKRTYSFVFGAADESKAAAIDPTLGIKGEVIKFVLVLPDWTNTVTAVVSMNNADGKEVFADDSRAQNEEYDITLDRNECIILGQADEEFVVTLSGVPGGSGGTATVTVYAEE